MEALAPFEALLGGIQVKFGAGRLDLLGAEALALGARRVLLVSDHGLEAAGHVARARLSLESAGLAVATFLEVFENPTTEHVDAGVEVAREFGPDLLVGLGGGSALDGTKGINFLLTNGGRMADYWGMDLAKKPMLPAIGVPTTGGTGSEGQRFALISDAVTHQKMACGDQKARFRTVLLDPELLATAPRRVAALAGVDALSHAVESFVTTRRNPFSQMLAREAFRHLESSFERSLEDPTDAPARASMSFGSHLAGAAIEASMLGAAHSCANPLTARFGTAHGAAVLLLLPHVVRFNARDVGPLYDQLAATVGLADAAALADRLEALRQKADLPERLRDAGVQREELQGLAEEAATQWTARFNPRPVGQAELLGLYQAAF
jgi:alcohol dehydrogenase